MAIDRDRYVDELAAVETELTRTNDAIDRYLTAFENGTMPEQTCGPRISALADKTKQLTRRRDELTLLLAETPTIGTPDPAHCQALRDHIHDILDTDEPQLARQLVQTLVHDIRVTGRHQVKPTFRIPTDSISQLAG
ncbi:MAG: hypothetical protein KJO75_09760, partial [Dactylosporangium sp.]|nr:hypothetical protein [Dactylosporangium sp.]